MPSPTKLLILFLIFSLLSPSLAVATGGDPSADSEDSAPEDTSQDTSDEKDKDEAGVGDGVGGPGNQDGSTDGPAGFNEADARDEAVDDAFGEEARDESVFGFGFDSFSPEDASGQAVGAQPDAIGEPNLGNLGRAVADNLGNPASVPDAPTTDTDRVGQAQQVAELGEIDTTVARTLEDALENLAYQAQAAKERAELDAVLADIPKSPNTIAPEDSAVVAREKAVEDREKAAKFAEDVRQATVNRAFTETVTQAEKNVQFNEEVAQNRAKQDFTQTVATQEQVADITRSVLGRNTATPASYAPVDKEGKPTGVPDITPHTAIPDNVARAYKEHADARVRSAKIASNLDVDTAFTRNNKTGNFVGNKTGISYNPVDVPGSKYAKEFGKPVAVVFTGTNDSTVTKNNGTLGVNIGNTQQTYQNTFNTVAGLKAKGYSVVAVPAAPITGMRDVTIQAAVKAGAEIADVEYGTTKNNDPNEAIHATEQGTKALASELSRYGVNTQNPATFVGDSNAVRGMNAMPTGTVDTENSQAVVGASSATITGFVDSVIDQQDTPEFSVTVDTQAGTITAEVAGKKAVDAETDTKDIGIVPAGNQGKNFFAGSLANPNVTALDRMLSPVPTLGYKSTYNATTKQNYFEPVVMEFTKNMTMEQVFDNYVQPLARPEERALGIAPALSQADLDALSLACAGECSHKTRNEIAKANGDLDKISDAAKQEIAAIMGAIENKAFREDETIADRVMAPAYLSSVTVDKKAYSNLSVDGKQAHRAVAEAYAKGTLSKNMTVDAPLMDDWSANFYNPAVVTPAWSTSFKSSQAISNNSTKSFHTYGNLANEGRRNQNNNYGKDNAMQSTYSIEGFTAPAVSFPNIGEPTSVTINSTPSNNPAPAGQPNTSPSQTPATPNTAPAQTPATPNTAPAKTPATKPSTAVDDVVDDVLPEPIADIVKNSPTYRAITTLFDMLSLLSDGTGGTPQPPTDGNETCLRPGCRLTSTYEARQSYTPVFVTIDEEFNQIQFSRQDIIEDLYKNNYTQESAAELLTTIEMASDDRPDILFDEYGTLLYSNGIYAPKTIEGVTTENNDKEFVYIVEKAGDANNLVTETESVSTLAKVVKVLHDSLRNSTPYDFGDIEAVTYQLQEDRYTTGSGYYKYEISLTNGRIVNLEVPLFVSVAELQTLLKESGYTDNNAIDIIGIAKAASVEDVDQNFFELLGKRVVTLFSPRVAEDTPNTVLPDTATDRSSGVDVDRIKAVHIYPNSAVECPDIPGLDDGYVYEAYLENELVEEAVTIITEARCGVGDPTTLIEQTALHLENAYNINNLSKQTLSNKVYFQLEPTEHQLGISSLLLDFDSDTSNPPVISAGNTDVTDSNDEDLLPNTTNTIIFEVRTSTSNGIVLQDWQSAEAIVINDGVQLDFRWDGSDYRQCLPFLADGGEYVLTRNDGFITAGDTALENFDVRETSTSYYIECAGQANGESGVDVAVIEVRVR